MMKALSRAYSKTHSLDLSHKPGLVNELLDTGVGVGASYVLGRVHGSGKAEVAGVPVNLLVGLLGKGALVASHVFAPGMSKAMGHHLNTVANAGLYSYFFARGVSAGASGTRMLGSASDVVLGAIPPAREGTFLSPEEIAHFAAKREA